MIAAHGSASGRDCSTRPTRFMCPSRSLGTCRLRRSWRRNGSSSRRFKWAAPRLEREGKTSRLECMCGEATRSHRGDVRTVAGSALSGSARAVRCGSFRFKTGGMFWTTICWPARRPTFGRCSPCWRGNLKRRCSRAGWKRRSSRRGIARNCGSSSPSGCISPMTRPTIWNRCARPGRCCARLGSQRPAMFCLPMCCADGQRTRWKERRSA